jgi:Fe-S cluster assembly iron-binding protein IscA
LGLALDELKDTDKAFDFDEIKFVIEEELLTKTGEIKIMYAQNPFGGGFKIESANPLAADAGSNSFGSCSC